MVEPSGLVEKQSASRTPARPALSRVIPQVLTPGIRVTAVEEVTFDVAVEIGLTPDQAAGVPVVPPYNVVFLASYNLDPFGVRSKRAAGPSVAVPVIIAAGGEDGTIVSGEVVDKNTGRPIDGAIVRFDRSTPVATDGEGRFASRPLDAGNLRVEVSAPGYETGSAELVLGPEAPELQVALAPSSAGVQGSVTTPAGPLGPIQVRVIGPETTEVTADTEGAFRADLPPGEYRLVLVPEDHLAVGALVAVGPGQTTSVSLETSPSEGRSVEPLEGRLPLASALTFDPEAPSVPANAGELLAPIVDYLLRTPGEGPRGRPFRVEREPRGTAGAKRDLRAPDQGGPPPKGRTGVATRLAGLWRSAADRAERDASRTTAKQSRRDRAHRSRVLNASRAARGSTFSKSQTDALREQVYLDHQSLELVADVRAS
ncbi:MAG: hypothetical protein HC923_08085 [Myxococcales bacterium]|nr:hypothetical protein [Myxococcales bacterium]